VPAFFSVRFAVSLLLYGDNHYGESVCYWFTELPGVQARIQLTVTVSQLRKGVCPDRGQGSFTLEMGNRPALRKGN
jgi:hypothetical protein